MQKSINYKILIMLIIPLLVITAVFSIKNTFAAPTMSIKVGDTNVSLAALSQGQLYVGYGKASIDPDPKNGPVPLQGFGSSYNRTATIENQYSQPLYATAVAIMDKDKKVAIFVTVDLCSISSDTVINNIKEKVTSKTGVSGERIMISLTHTHSGPEVTFNNASYPNLNSAINAYKTLLYNQIAQASYDALKDLSPADISIGKTNVENADGSNILNFVRNYKAKPKNTKYDITVNRGTTNNDRIYLADEKKWITDFDMIAHQTKADTTLQLIKFKKSKGKDIVMINWQVHPVITGAPSEKVISSDFIDTLRNEVEKSFNCRVAYFSGGAANINPYTEIESEKNELTRQGSTTKEKYDTSIKYGKKLSEYVAKIYNKTKKVSADYVNLKQEKVSLKYKDVTDAEFNNATYIDKISKTGYSDIAKMIEGTYNWPTDYKFPLNFDKSGSKLRQIIKFSPYLQKVFILTGNDKDGYKCTAKDVTSTHVRGLILYIGSMFEDYKIHGTTHASTLISAKKRVNQSGKIELNAISLGSIAFATAQYEMFDISAKEIREETRKNSPIEMTFVLSLTNGKKGYMPTKDVYEYGSYETNITHFPKGTAEKLSSKLVSLISSATIRVSKIEIKTMPTKLTYFQNQEELSLDGGKILVYYTDKTTRAIELSNSNISIKGFNNNTLGEKEIVVSYSGKTTKFKVNIIEAPEDKPSEPIESESHDSSVPVSSDNSKINNAIIYVAVVIVIILIAIVIIFKLINLKKKNKMLEETYGTVNNNFDNSQSVQYNGDNYQNNDQNNSN